MRRVEGVEGVVSVRHWTSGSEVISFLRVREMWVAVLERKAATHDLSCAGDWRKIDVKEGWEIVLQVLLLLSNRTQGSWIRIMSVVLCARWRSVSITCDDFAVLCCTKRMWEVELVWWVPCAKGCAHIRQRCLGGRWSEVWGLSWCPWMLC